MASPLSRSYIVGIELANARHVPTHIGIHYANAYNVPIMYRGQLPQSVEEGR